MNGTPSATGQYNQRFSSNQQGSVLTFSLLILLVITIIGATALNNTVTEEKMSANYQNGQLAFQAAESSINKTLLQIEQNRVLVEKAIQAKNDAIANTEPDWPAVAPSDLVDNSDTANPRTQTTLNATVRYVGENFFPAAGCSVAIGKNTSCKAVVVDVKGSGTVSGTSITRTHIQGAQKQIPSDG